MTTHLPATTNLPRLAPRWAAALLVTVGLMTLASGLAGEFIFDDLKLHIFDPRYQTPWPLGPLKQTHRALADWTFQLNHALGGRNALGYHLTNLGIHLAAALTLLGLVRRTLQLPGIAPRFSHNADFLALAIALVWLVHPLQTESVTYIVQRYESLMGLSFLLVLYCTLRGSQSAKSWLWYGAAIVAAWAGAASKEVMAACPLVLLVFDRAFLTGSWRLALRRRWGLYLAIVPSIGWMLWAIRQAFDPQAPSGGAGFGLPGLSSWEYLRSQPGVILYYLRLAIWPDELILDRGWPVTHSPLAIYGLGAIVLALVALSLWGTWKHPKLGFLGLAFFLILAPTSTIVPIADLAVEHRMYLPLAPLAALAILAVATLLDRARLSELARLRVATAALGIVVVALAARTIRRNDDYAHPQRLWQQVIANNPRHARGYRNLAGYAIKANRLDEAERLFRRALALQPRNPRNWLELGNVQFRRLDTAGAIRCYERALVLDPKSGRAWTNISTCRLVQAEYAAALAAARRAIAASPNDPEPRKQAAWLLATAPDDKVRSGQEALLILQPLLGSRSLTDLHTLEILAAAQAEAGRFDEAIRTAQRGANLAHINRHRRQTEAFVELVHRYQAHQPTRSQPPSAEELAAAARAADRGA